MVSDFRLDGDEGDEEGERSGALEIRSLLAISDWMLKKVRLGAWAFGFVALRL